MLAWLSESDRWRAVVTVVAHEGAGAFLAAHALRATRPHELEGAETVGEGQLRAPLRRRQRALLLAALDGAQLDDLARGCARELRMRPLARARPS